MSWIRKDNGEITEFGKVLRVGTDVYTAGLAEPLWQNADYKSNLTNQEKQAQDAIARADALPEKEFAPTSELTQANIEAWNQYRLAQNRAKYGLSADEKNLALSVNAQNQNLAEQNAVLAGGGGLASYVNATQNAANNQFGLALAAKDQEVMRQKQNDILPYLSNAGNMAGVFQDINNQEVNRLYNIKQNAELMAGGALSSVMERQDMLRNANQQYISSLVNAGTQIAATAAKTA